MTHRQDNDPHHHQDHADQHDHDHRPGHHHHHDHDAVRTETTDFSNKLEKLLEHWLRHNDDHVKSYREWAQQAREKGHSEAAGHIESASGLMGQISERFSAALDAVRKG